MRPYHIMRSSSFLPRLLLPASLLLTSCGGGDIFSEILDKANRDVWLDKYEDSCGGGSDWKTVTYDRSGQQLAMSIRVNTSGDVEPLSWEWRTESNNSIGGSASFTDSVDGTGRKFTRTATLTGTGDISVRLLIKDRKGIERFVDYCRIHVKT